MKRFSVVGTFVLLAVLPWVFLRTGQTTGQESHQGTEAGSDGTVITMSLCRIRLIDRFTLASDQTGILAFVEPEEGDVVRQGHEIAGLKDEVAAAAHQIAEKRADNDIQVKYASAAAAVAETELLKAMETNRQVEGAVPDIEIQRLRLAWEKSQLSIELAHDEFSIAGLEAKEAKARLKMYRVEAPSDGVVTQVYKRKGEAVRQGDPILDLVNTDRVRVEGRVDVKDVWKVKRGMAVRVRLDIPDVQLPEENETFEGRVVFVDVAVQPVTREVRVWAEVTNQDNILKDGLTATMVVDTSQRTASSSKLQKRSQEDSPVYE